jgi:two-component system, OmpR family, response regulator
VNILVVEDDLNLANVIKRGLTKSGHVIHLAHDGLAALYLAKESAFDSIVLDLTLPGMDGVSVTRDLRRDRVETPILMLTARDTVEDTIVGLDAGANDYLRKPFVFAELDARLRTIARKTPCAVRELVVGNVRLDLVTRAVSRDECTIPLTARETAFLEFFMRRPGQIVTRAMLENAFWEHGRYIESNVAEVYVSRLRGKLQLRGSEPLIRTVRGAGYRFS